MISLFLTSTVYAADTPLSNTIDKAQIQLVKKNEILVSWRQQSKVPIVVYKLSYDRKGYSNCSTDLQTFTAPYCKVIWSRSGLVGNIRITDKEYRQGDDYYILEYKYSRHNGAYGPLRPSI